MRRIGRALWLLLLLGGGRPAIGAAPSPEYEVKAAFLFRFAQFVEWPASTFDHATSPVTFCILGRDPFGPTLEQIVRGESIGERPIVVRRAAQVQDLGHCHLLFVSQSERGRLDVVLRDLTRQAVLTVGEVDGFAKRGGVINFVIENSRVRFEINPSAARREGLRVSSGLLGLARIVDAATPGEEDRRQ